MAAPVPFPRRRQRANNTPSSATSTTEAKVNDNAFRGSVSSPIAPSIYPKLDEETFPSLFRESFEMFLPEQPKVQKHPAPPSCEPSRPAPAPPAFEPTRPAPAPPSSDDPSRPVAAPRRTKEDSNRWTYYQNAPPVEAVNDLRSGDSLSTVTSTRINTKLRSEDGENLEESPEITDLMTGIRFSSPLSNVVVNSQEDTYYIPTTAQRTDFKKSLPCPDSIHSKSNSKIHPDSTSSSTENLSPVVKTFPRNTSLSSSLHKKILPTKERNGYNESLEPLQQNTDSESNLKNSTCYIDERRHIEVANNSESIPPLTKSSPDLHGAELPSSLNSTFYITPVKDADVVTSTECIPPWTIPTLNSHSDEEKTLPQVPKREKIRKKNENNEAVDSRCSSENQTLSRGSSSIESNLSSNSTNFLDVTNVVIDHQNSADSDDGSFRISTPEPTNINEDQIFGQICDIRKSLLQPQPARPTRHDNTESSISDINDEFDPLANRQSLGSILENAGQDNELSLIGNILSAETSETIVNEIPKPKLMDLTRHEYDESSISDVIGKCNSSAYRQSLAVILENVSQDSEQSLIENILSVESYGTFSNETADVLPELQKPSDSQQESITSKTTNMDLPPLPNPRQNDIIQQNLNKPSDSIENLVDEAEIEPKSIAIQQQPVEGWSPTTNLVQQSSWFGSDDVSTPQLDEFPGNVEPVEKVQEELTREPIRIEEDERLNTETVPESGASSNSQPNVTSMPSNTQKPKPSLRTKVDTQPIPEMIPKPFFTDQLISHQGHVQNISTEMIEEVFNELTPRSVVLKEKIIQTYQDLLKTQPKETLHLKFMLSVQSVIQHKFNNEGGLNLHCFEVVLELPKKEGNSDGSQQGTHLNLVSTQSYTFGVQTRMGRNLWMTKILQSVTDVFPDTYLTEFTRAGWCYMKKSVSSSWSGAWLLLAKRKLYFFNYQDAQLEHLDLRRARCIGETEPDESIRNLHAEVGRLLFIDCPPYATLYFITASSRETQMWKKVIKEAAHKNGTSLQSQQLTKDKVPVIIDKCINFIYAHGSMSEWIYRRSGSSRKINKILELFKEDGFAVQLPRDEFSEFDVAAALKKFIRDIPDSFFGSYAVNFVSIACLRCTEDKISAYKELLTQLPKILYQTLKKLIGHLSFIASLEKDNKMGVSHLAMIWGLTLMGNFGRNLETEQKSYLQEGVDVVADLIKLYKELFPISSEEMVQEQLMLKLLHTTVKDPSDNVKHSGDLKFWITIECDLDTIQTATIEDKTQINVTLTPTKTASDICKELASETPYEWNKLTLFEVISDGSLTRPVHYNEKALDIVLKWTYWDDADKKNNYLAVRPVDLNNILRHNQLAPTLSPDVELKFADRGTETLRSYKLQLTGREIGVLKQVDESTYEELMKINLETVHAFLGGEPKRDQSDLGWAITLVERDFTKRTRDAPFIGHILGGADLTDQIVWYFSILHNLHYAEQ